MVLSLSLYIPTYTASKNGRYLQEETGLVFVTDPLPPARLLSFKHHETLGDFTLFLKLPGTIFYLSVPPQNSAPLGGKSISVYLGVL